MKRILSLMLAIMLSCTCIFCVSVNAAEADISISNWQVTYGKTAGALDVSFDVTMKNETGGAAKVILAAYKGTRMIDAEMSKIESITTAGNTVNVKLSDVDASADEYKLFVWNDAMSPYQDAVEFTVTDKIKPEIKLYEYDFSGMSNADAAIKGAMSATVVLDGNNSVAKTSFVNNNNFVGLMDATEVMKNAGPGKYKFDFKIKKGDGWTEGETSAFKVMARINSSGGEVAYEAGKTSTATSGVNCKKLFNNSEITLTDSWQDYSGYVYITAGDIAAFGQFNQEWATVPVGLMVNGSFTNTTVHKYVLLDDVKLQKVAEVQYAENIISDWSFEEASSVSGYTSSSGTLSFNNTEAVAGYRSLEVKANSSNTLWIKKTMEGLTAGDYTYSVKIKRSNTGWAKYYPGVQNWNASSWGSQSNEVTGTIQESPSGWVELTQDFTIAQDNDKVTLYIHAQESDGVNCDFFVDDFVVIKKN